MSVNSIGNLFFKQSAAPTLVSLAGAATISEWIYEVIVSPKIRTKNCQDFCPHYTAEILTIFRSYFGRNDDFINSFWNSLTFTTKVRFKYISGFVMKFILWQKIFWNSIFTNAKCNTYFKRKYEKKATFTFDRNWASISNLVFETDFSQLSCNTFVSFWVLWSLK